MRRRTQFEQEHGFVYADKEWDEEKHKYGLELILHCSQRAFSVHNYTERDMKSERLPHWWCAAV